MGGMFDAVGMMSHGMMVSAPEDVEEEVDLEITVSAQSVGDPK